MTPARQVFRFAPSPHGRLHLGHALSALLNADLAQACGGRFLLRIEDIDRLRSKPAFEAGIVEDLAWLGLDWEKPVRRQSDHFDAYAASLDRLAGQGLLFPCFCVRADLPSTGPRDPDGAPLYPGTCRALPPEEARRRLAAGEPHALRLDMQAALLRCPAQLSWEEAEEGRVAADPAVWGDAVLRRKDTPASYHIAVVTDDALQSITDVVRGRDLYHATSLHRLLQALLGLPEQRYRHHPLIAGPDGRKLSKSHDAPSLAALRAQGVTPAQVRAMVGL